MERRRWLWVNKFLGKKESRFRASLGIITRHVICMVLVWYFDDNWQASCKISYNEDDIAPPGTEPEVDNLNLHVKPTAPVIGITPVDSLNLEGEPAAAVIGIAPVDGLTIEAQPAAAVIDNHLPVGDSLNLEAQPAAAVVNNRQAPRHGGPSGVSRTLRLTPDQAKRLSSKGAIDTSNFTAPTPVYIAVPVISIFLAIFSIWSYIKWKRNLLRKREKRLDRVSDKRRRTSFKPGSAAANQRTLIFGLERDLELEHDPAASITIPAALIGLAGELENVEKMVLEFQSLDSGASIPDKRQLVVKEEQYDVNINPLYNALQSGACGYVLSGVKNPTLVGLENQRRSTLLLQSAQGRRSNFAGRRSTLNPQLQRSPVRPLLRPYVVVPETNAVAIEDSVAIETPIAMEDDVTSSDERSGMAAARRGHSFSRTSRTSRRGSSTDSAAKTSPKRKKKMRSLPTDDDLLDDPSPTTSAPESPSNATSMSSKPSTSEGSPLSTSSQASSSVAASTFKKVSRSRTSRRSSVTRPVPWDSSTNSKSSRKAVVNGEAITYRKSSRASGSSASISNKSERPA